MTEQLTQKEKCSVIVLLFMFALVFGGFIVVISTPTISKPFENSPEGIIEYIGHYNFHLKSITEDIIQFFLNINSNAYNPTENLYQYVIFKTLKSPPFPEEIHYVIPMDLSDKYERDKWIYLKTSNKPLFYLPEDIVVFPAINGNGHVDYFYINDAINEKINFDDTKVYSDWECDTLDKTIWLKNNPPDGYQFDSLQTHVEAGLAEPPPRPSFCFGDWPWISKINRVRALYKKI